MRLTLDVSPAELIDRLSIELRRTGTDGPAKMKALVQINCDLWALEEEPFSPERAKSIHAHSRIRAKLKKDIDEALGYEPERKSEGWKR